MNNKVTFTSKDSIYLFSEHDSVGNLDLYK